MPDHVLEIVFKSDLTEVRSDLDKLREDAGKGVKVPLRGEAAQQPGATPQTQAASPPPGQPPAPPATAAPAPAPPPPQKTYNNEQDRRAKAMGYTDAAQYDALSADPRRKLLQQDETLGKERMHAELAAARRRANEEQSRRQDVLKQQEQQKREIIQGNLLLSRVPKSDRPAVEEQAKRLEQDAMLGHVAAIKESTRLYEQGSKTFSRFLADQGKAQQEESRLRRARIEGRLLQASPADRMAILQEESRRLDAVAAEQPNDPRALEEANRVRRRITQEQQAGRRGGMLGRYGGIGGAYLALRVVEAGLAVAGTEAQARDIELHPQRLLQQMDNYATSRSPQDDPFMQERARWVTKYQASQLRQQGITGIPLIGGIAAGIYNIAGGAEQTGRNRETAARVERQMNLHQQAVERNESNDQRLSAAEGDSFGAGMAAVRRQGSILARQAAQNRDDPELQKQWRNYVKEGNVEINRLIRTEDARKAGVVATGEIAHAEGREIDAAFYRNQMGVLLARRDGERQKLNAENKTYVATGGPDAEREKRQAIADERQKNFDLDTRRQVQQTAEQQRASSAVMLANAELANKQSNAQAAAMRGFTPAAIQLQLAAARKSIQKETDAKVSVADQSQQDAIRADGAARVREAEVQAQASLLDYDRQRLLRRGAIASNAAQLNNDPLGAQLAQIRAQTAAANAGKSILSPEYWQNATQGSQQQALARTQFARQRQDVGRGQDTRGKVMDDVMARRYEKAEADQTTGDTRQREAELRRAGMDTEADRELKLGQKQLDMQRKQYLLGFRAEQIDLPLMSPFNPRDQADVSRDLKDIDNAKKGLDTPEAQRSVSISDVALGALQKIITDAIKSIAVRN